MVQPGSSAERPPWWSFACAEGTGPVSLSCDWIETLILGSGDLGGEVIPIGAHEGFSACVVRWRLDVARRARLACRSWLFGWHVVVVT